MKIYVDIPDPLGKNLQTLQTTLGLSSLEDLTIHALKVLHYLVTTIRHDRCTLSQEATHWILAPFSTMPSTESSRENPDVSHSDLDRQIRQEIHQLLDDDQFDQALKVTRIFKLLKSHTNEHSQNHLVKSEMLLTAAETFAEESDPEKAAQLIMDATHETHEQPKEAP